MTTAKRLLVGCVIFPGILFTSCCGKMYIDHKLYNLPGDVLTSSARPTQSLTTAMQTAEALDSYVQPRFEILRDKNFGAMRIVYHKHAGIVQLKVDSQREKELIANVNAANRDYVIYLLHCAPKPDQGYHSPMPRLELLYYNQERIVSDSVHGSMPKTIVEEKKLDMKGHEKLAVKSLPQLMKGTEHRASDKNWELLMRPVLTSKQECLSCHKTSKQGDTLGVMVYAIRKTKRSEDIKVGLR